MARVSRTKRNTIVGVNWHLKLRLKIETLENLVDKLYAENQIMKRRLKKYELTKTSKSSNLTSD
jgi:hypothetical protein